MTVVAVRAPLGWLGPGRLIQEPLVVIEDEYLAYAGPASEVGTVAAGRTGLETLAGAPAPHEADEEILFDGFLMPGVVDRHVHIALGDPGAVVAGGVTAVRDLGWPPDEALSLAAASEGPSFNGPLIRAVGPVITCPGGYPVGADWAPKGTGLEIDGAEEAAEAVHAVLGASGLAVLKVALNSEAGPTLSDEELLAVCDEAHAEGAIVTAHVQGKGQAERAVGAGVDEFAHCPWTELLPGHLMDAVARRMRIVSTLDIHSHGRDTPELRTATANLRRFIEAGGRVVYGTDFGNGPIPPGIHLGEVRHLAAAGVGAEALLEALTFRPLAAGESADLIGLAGNPLEDLNALARVRLVIRGGRRMR